MALSVAAIVNLYGETMPASGAYNEYSMSFEMFGSIFNVCSLSNISTLTPFAIPLSYSALMPLYPSFGETTIEPHFFAGTCNSSP